MAAHRVSRVVLVPGVLALLPEYAGLTDPVAELRAACLAAVGWLTEGLGGEDSGGVTVLADGSGERVAAALLAAVGGSNGAAASGRYLVVGNGSARRGEKAPGHLDERSFAFDDALDRALRAPDPAALADLDQALGDELLADVANLARLGDLLAGTGTRAPTVDYAGDPFGVQYWVLRWPCDS